MHSDDQQISFKFKSLIFKHAILTLIGNISTIGCPLLWMMTDIVAFLYFDILINSMVIGLGFKYNEKVYKRLCAPCITGCFLKCDKSKSRSRRQTVEAYLHRDHTFSTSTFSVSPKSAFSPPSASRPSASISRPTMLAAASTISTTNVHVPTLHEQEEVRSDSECDDHTVDHSSLPLPDVLKIPHDISTDSVTVNTIELQSPPVMEPEIST